MTSFIPITSNEAIKECTDYLNSKEAYLSLDGTLRFGINNNISELVLYNFTRGLIEKDNLRLEELTAKDTYVIPIATEIVMENELYMRSDVKRNKEQQMELEKEMLKQLTTAPNIYVAGKLNGQAVCFIRFKAYSNNPKKGSFGIGILDKYKGMGFGRTLLVYLLRKLKANDYEGLDLTVHPENTRAIELYKSLGFTTVKQIDKLTMSMTLEL